MKKSNLSLEQLKGIRKRARSKKREDKHSLVHYFKKPIIHKQIQGERVYVPLSIQRVWNEV
nr:hypothetical protein [Neobacillus sp. Marseille-Q6967]